MSEHHFYYCSEFKNSNETNNNFNIILDDNIIIGENQSVYLKINNVCFLNSMFNISSYHNNNYIDITHESILTRIYIPDGNYSVYTLRDKLNTLLDYAKIIMTYDTLDYTYSFKTQNNTVLLDPCNLKDFLGVPFPILIGTNIQWGNKVDLRSYNKIILTSSLTFKNNPYNNFISKYSSTSGIGSICCWCERDSIPYSTIEYNNLNDIKNEIVDRNIKNINFKIFNEYKEEITDMSNINIHFSIIIYNNYNLTIIRLLKYIRYLLDWR